MNSLKCFQADDRSVSNSRVASQVARQVAIQVAGRRRIVCVSIALPVFLLVLIHRVDARPPVSGQFISQQGAKSLPSLSGYRLFIDDAQRSQLDASGSTQAPSISVAQTEVAAVAPTEVVPSAVEKEVLVRPVAYRFDGMLVRPDGTMAIWINGSLLEKDHPEISASMVSTAGPLLLRAYGQEFLLRPGQKVTALVSAERLSR